MTLWTIYAIWVIFAIVCIILIEVYEHEFVGFFLLLSFIVMFYVPFMV